MMLISVEDSRDHESQQRDHAEPTNSRNSVVKLLCSPWITGIMLTRDILVEDRRLTGFTGAGWVCL